MVNPAQIEDSEEANVIDSTDESIPLKAYSLVGVTTLIALLGGYLLSKGLIFVGTLVAGIFLVCFSLQIIFLGNRYHLFLAVIINSLALALFFYQAFSFYFIVALLILIGFLYLSVRRGRSEMENLMKVSIFRIVRASIGYGLTALIIFLGAALILNSQFSFTREKVDKLVDATLTPLAKRYVPDFSPEMKMETFLTKLAERNLVANKGFQALSASLKKEAIGQSVVELQRQIEGSLGAKLQLNQSVAENIYQVLLIKVGSLTPVAKLYWSLLLVGLIWLTIKSVEFLIYLPFAILVFIVYELLLALDFAKVEFEPRSKEVVLLK